MTSQYDDVLGLVRWQRREAYADVSNDSVVVEEDQLDEAESMLDEILTLEPSPEVQAEIAKLINPVQAAATPETSVQTRQDIPLMLVSTDGGYKGEVAKLLTAMLSAIKFERSQVTTASVATLAEKLAEYKPSVIIVFGEDAARSMLGNQNSLSSERNKIHYYSAEKIPFVVTHHPASLLTNTSAKRPAWEDLCLLRKHYDAL